MEIIEKISLQEVREAQPKKIYWAARTCWWTHDPKHLSTLPDGLPCDPRGSVLFETDKVEDFLKAAENKSWHYGKHGLRAFMAAHHLNCYSGLIVVNHWSSDRWIDYNDAIDRLIEREKLILGSELIG